ncbi:MAG: hypothetical protein AB2L18_09860 [Anaerolineaceae bacterium]
METQNKKLPVMRRQSKGGTTTSAPRGAGQHKEGYAADWWRYHY